MINVQPICRICKEKVESVTHIGISCSVTAGNQFRKRYGKLKEKVHWLLCKKFDKECAEKLFSHQPESALENGKYKIR